MLAMVQTLQDVNGEVVIPDMLLKGDLEEETLLILDEPSVLIVEDDPSLVTSDVAQQNEQGEVIDSEPIEAATEEQPATDLASVKAELIAILDDLEN
jgi:hypothetical protein